MSGPGAELAERLSVETADDNLGLVRTAYRLRLDSARIDETARSIRRFLELLAPDIELMGQSQLWCSCRGRLETANALVDAARRWAECSFALEEAQVPEPGHVLACGTAVLRPSGSTEVRTARFADLWTIKEGLAVRVEGLTQ